MRPYKANSFLLRYNLLELYVDLISPDGVLGCIYDH